MVKNLESGKWMRALAMFGMLAAQHASGADWHFAGGANDYRGRLEILFYDSETVTRPSDGIVRFWLDGFLKQNILAYFESHQSKLTVLAARKLASGYVPELALQYPSPHERKKNELDTITAAILYEVVIQSGALNRSSEVYEEIDCRNRQLRTLDMSFYDNKGNLVKSSDGEATEWMYIPPDSNGERWANIFCRK